MPHLLSMLQKYFFIRDTRKERYICMNDIHRRDIQGVTALNEYYVTLSLWNFISIKKKIYFLIDIIMLFSG